VHPPKDRYPSDTAVTTSVRDQEEREAHRGQTDDASPISTRRRWRGVAAALVVSIVGCACVQLQAVSRRVPVPLAVRIEGIPASTDAERWRVTQTVLDNSRARQAARDAVGPRSPDEIVAIAQERLASLTLEWESGEKPSEVNLTLHDEAGTSPYETVAVVNRLAELLIDELRGERMARAQSAFRQCEKQVAIARDDAARAWDRLTVFAEREMANAQSSSAPVSATPAVEQRARDSGPVISPEELAARDELTALRLQQAEMLRYLQPAHPQALEIARRRAESEARLEAIQANARIEAPEVFVPLEATVAEATIVAATHRTASRLPAEKRAVFEQRIASYHRASAVHTETAEAAQAAWRDWVDAKTSPGPILRPAVMPAASDPAPRWPWFLVTLGAALAAGGAATLAGADEESDDGESSQHMSMREHDYETLEVEAASSQRDDRSLAAVVHIGPRLAALRDED